MIFASHPKQLFCCRMQSEKSSSCGVSYETMTRYEPTWSLMSHALSRSIVALVSGSVRAVAIFSPHLVHMDANSAAFCSAPFSYVGLTVYLTMGISMTYAWSTKKRAYNKS